jgi:hypothetical protein
VVPTNFGRPRAYPRTALELIISLRGFRISPNSWSKHASVEAFENYFKIVRFQREIKEDNSFFGSY